MAKTLNLKEQAQRINATSGATSRVTSRTTSTATTKTTFDAAKSTLRASFESVDERAPGFAAQAISEPAFDLVALRAKISQIDEELQRLFCERLALVKLIAQSKATTKAAIYQPEIQAQKQKTLAANLPNLLNKLNLKLDHQQTLTYLRLFQDLNMYLACLWQLNEPALTAEFTRQIAQLFSDLNKY